VGSSSACSSNAGTSNNLKPDIQSRMSACIIEVLGDRGHSSRLHLLECCLRLLPLPAYALMREFSMTTTGFSPVACICLNSSTAFLQQVSRRLSPQQQPPVLSSLTTMARVRCGGLGWGVALPGTCPT